MHSVLQRFYTAISNADAVAAVANHCTLFRTQGTGFVGIDLERGGFNNKSRGSAGLHRPVDGSSSKESITDKDATPTTLMPVSGGKLEPWNASHRKENRVVLKVAGEYSNSASS